MLLVFWGILSILSLAILKMIKESLAHKNYLKALGGVVGIFLLILIASAFHAFAFKHY